MGLLAIILLLIVAGVCGALGQTISGYSRGGCLASIVLGFIGALLGTWMARVLDLPELLSVDVGTTRFPIVWSIIGASIFVALLGFMSGNKGASNVSNN